MRHQLKRRLIVLLSAVVVLVGASAGSAVGGEDGVLFGAYSGPRTGESEQAAVLRMERDVGRELDVVREFVQWDERFDSYLTWLQQSERTVILSVKSNRLNGTVIPWADIANAQPGSTLHNEMVAWADRMKAWAKPVYFAFNHEPEAGINRSKGTATDYINAFRALRQVFRDRGVTNTKFIWIMTDYAFFVGPQDRRDAAKWYPGDAYVDAMGADAYNWFTCRTGIDTAWWTLERIIEPFRDFGAAHPDKELWLTEFGSAEDPANPARKAEWFAQAQALFKRADYSQFVGVSYFDRFGGDQCYWQPSSSPASLAAFRAMGQDSFYGGPATPPPDPDPEPSDASFVAVAGRNGNYTNHTVTVPSSVQAGDLLVLFFAANSSTVTHTPPTGWQSVQQADVSGMRGRAWVRTATASDAGSVVTVRNSAIVKADLTVAAYRGVSAVDVSAVAVDATSRTQHVAPSVTPTRAGGWLVAYWADKSDTNTNHSLPAALTRRRTATGTSGGHITATVADLGAVTGTAPTGTFTATGTSSSTKAVMFTIALRP